MSEERILYGTAQGGLLNTEPNHATLEPEQSLLVIVDWLQLERMLLPLLNYARRMQGKKPVIVPK